MATEIERKFLVRDAGAAIAASTGSVRIAQGYLSMNPEATVRVRLRGDAGRLTVKSRTVGCTRGEWEYGIPAEDARELLGLCTGGVIEKTRYLVPHGGRTWEVDVFHRPEGLVLAEVELQREDEEVSLPDWAGDEVTGDARYYNSNIAAAADAGGNILYKE